jgi:GNAT superfamily N-acetyltransferase
MATQYPSPVTDDITIRPARIEDHAAICELASIMDNLHLENLPDRFRAHDGPARTEEYIRNLIGNEDTYLAVAVRDGGLVAIINCGLARTPDIPIKVRRRYLKIRGLVVKPGMRRQGIGREMMSRAQKWARSRGADEVQLNVYRYNDGAEAFYARLGFEPLSRRMVRPL